MENILVKYLEHPKLNDPIFIEGLPGIGNVGKLAADRRNTRSDAKNAVVARVG